MLCRHFSCRRRVGTVRAVTRNLDLAPTNFGHQCLTNGGVRNFHLGAIARMIWQWGPGTKPRIGVLKDENIPQKLNQFADIVYRFRL